MFDKLVWSLASPWVIYKSIGLTLDLLNPEERMDICICIRLPAEFYDEANIWDSFTEYAFLMQREKMWSNLSFFNIFIKKKNNN